MRFCPHPERAISEMHPVLEPPGRVVVDFPNADCPWYGPLKRQLGIERHIHDAELRCPPFPFRAGFCITDDTDTATLDSVRLVYDTLHEHGVFATKTVWAFPPEEPCGVPGSPPSIQRGISLADRGYRDYCASLAQRGFELTRHGATAGNNTRDRTLRGFAALDEIAPRSPVYIRHAKNA